MTPTATLPEKLFVTLKAGSGDEKPLGFMSPDGTDAAAQKRHQTQLKWAYRYNVSLNEDNQYGAMVPVETEVGQTRQWQLLPDDVCPRVIENKPVAGFVLSRSVRRGGWNGGNVVWRVEDPRGFELEITSANFAAIVSCTTIINGEIQGECAWGRDNGANLLLPVTSEPYQAAVALTERASTSIGLREIKPGDIVDLLLKGVDTGTDGVEYLGKFHGYNVVLNDYDTVKLNYEEHSYLFRSLDQATVWSVKSPKISKLIKAADTAKDREAIARELAGTMAFGACWNSTRYFSPTKIDPDALRVVPGKMIAESITAAEFQAKYSKSSVIVETRDRLWLSTMNSDSLRKTYSRSILQLIAINASARALTMEHLTPGFVDTMFMPQPRPLYAYQHQRIDLMRVEPFEDEVLDRVYELAVEYNGEQRIIAPMDIAL